MPDPMTSPLLHPDASEPDASGPASIEGRLRSRIRGLVDRRVAVLAVGTFAVGTDSFVVAGILPQIGGSLHVSVGSAGLLVTVFALSYAVLSPVLASLTASWPRKRLMLFGLAVLALGNMLTALAPSYALVLASRAVVGVGAAMYTPTASATAAALVPPQQRARALAIVMTGLSAATALGAPIGTLIGSLGSWRNTMWFVAALAIAAAVGINALMPTPPSLPRVGLRRRLAPLRDLRIALTLATTFLLLAGMYTVYTYISVSYDRATNNSGTTLAVLLVAFGVAATAGNLASGRFTDKFGNTTVINLAAGISVLDFALMPISSSTLPTAIVAILIWGLCGWGVLVPQQHRLIQISPAAAPLAIALNASALYLAVAASGPIGAAGIHNAGAHQLGLVGAALILVGLATAQAAQIQLTRTNTRNAP